MVIAWRKFRRRLQPRPPTTDFMSKPNSASGQARARMARGRRGDQEAGEGGKLILPFYMWLQLPNRSNYVSLSGHGLHCSRSPSGIVCQIQTIGSLDCCALGIFSRYWGDCKAPSRSREPKVRRSCVLQLRGKMTEHAISAAVRDKPVRLVLLSLQHNLLQQQAVVGLPFV